MEYNPFSIEGKTILVTGASSGIGQSTAIECSKLGANVVLTARNEERLKRTLSELEGEGHKYIITELTAAEQMAELVIALPALDGVVLCAGKGMTLPFTFCTRDKFNDLFDVNYFAPVELLRLLVKKKKLNANSSVVFVSSVAGIESFNVGNGIYGASKAALNATMQFCAKELACKKVRVNSVCPGMVNTQLVKDTPFTQEQHEKNLEKYAIKRYGEPEEIAHGIIYLLSDAASWVTGHSLFIDGGLTI